MGAWFKTKNGDWMPVWSSDGNIHPEIAEAELDTRDVRECREAARFLADRGEGSYSDLYRGFLTAAYTRYNGPHYPD